MTVRNGQLIMGAQPFTRATLVAWQQHEWWHSVREIKNETGKPPAQDFTGLIRETLSRLPDDTWVQHDAIEPLLRLFYGKTNPPDPRAVCERGWTLGCLAKHTPGPGKPDYYRLPSADAKADQEPTAYLTIADGDALRVDLKTVPYAEICPAVDKNSA